jgi:hypothetical protein
MKVYPFKEECPSWIIKFVMDSNQFKMISAELKRQGLLEKWSLLPREDGWEHGGVLEINQDFVRVAESLGVGENFRLEGKFIAMELEENYDLLLAALTQKSS